MEAEALIIKSKEGFVGALRGWYLREARDLPWRRDPSVYKTVVSEFMLQQTQVDTVLPYFAAWLGKFPDFEALAKAEEGEVLKLWEGLGYYNRARNLHKLAKEVVAMGVLPEDAEGWQALPGIGPYTAAAVSSIGFGYPAAVVDGNVVRVLSRLTANGTEFKDNGSAVKAFNGLAQSLLNEEDPNRHNQAMMELGATVCHKQKPLCTICPVYAYCEAGKMGGAEAFPKLVRKKIKKVKQNRAWVEKDGALLLRKRPADAKRLANVYELPEIPDAAVVGLEPWVVKKRGISNERIEESIYRDVEGIEGEWVKLESIGEITLSGPHKRWIKQLLGIR